MSCVTASIKLSALNGHLICGLCGGYLIDATVLTECIHAFCRSCILKYLTEHKVCPLCQSLIQENRPGQALQPDINLQRVVYKLVPGLLRTEMQRLSQFCSSLSSPSSEEHFRRNSEKNHTSNALGEVSDFHPAPLPTALATRSLSKSPSALPPGAQLVGGRLSYCNRVPNSAAFLVSESELVSISLTRLASSSELPPVVLPERDPPVFHPNETFGQNQTPTLPFKFSLQNPSLETIYLLCPSIVTVQTLHNLLLAKYQLDQHQSIVDLYLNGECLEPSHSLREIAFLYTFPAKQKRMCFEFAFAEARLAWWGRPMPRLERPRQKSLTSSQNNWPTQTHICTYSSSDSTEESVPRQRSRSISGEVYRAHTHHKSKRTSL
ncbi:hypothetical protein P879_09715 [Paragonimus westermani]|uniref:RING-type domain-containing protein n=1 Tax=Paragonimus westermani TaxID=34504 RepID=A0A8T0D3J1_9TREM|nr:hypothetical protein P879_09715 [Paragonimus westermani]